MPVLGKGKQIALDVARGLEYLHSQHVVHLDLKSPNGGVFWTDLFKSSSQDCKYKDVACGLAFPAQPPRRPPGFELPNGKSCHWSSHLKLLKSSGCLSQCMKRRAGLAFLHSQHIVYLDLKISRWLGF